MNQNNIMVLTLSKVFAMNDQRHVQKRSCESSCSTQRQRSYHTSRFFSLSTIHNALTVSKSLLIVSHACKSSSDLLECGLCRLRVHSFLFRFDCCHFVSDHMHTFPEPEVRSGRVMHACAC